MLAIIRFLMVPCFFLLSACSVMDEIYNPFDQKHFMYSGLNLSEYSYKKALSAEYKCIMYGKPNEYIFWQDLKTKERGAVMAKNFYQVGSQTCRELIHTIFTANESNVIRKVACRNLDGKWFLLH